MGSGQGGADLRSSCSHQRSGGRQTFQNRGRFCEGTGTYSFPQDRRDLSSADAGDGLCEARQYCVRHGFPYHDLRVCGLLFFRYRLYGDGGGAWHRRDVDQGAGDDQSGDRRQTAGGRLRKGHHPASDRRSAGGWGHLQSVGIFGEYRGGDECFFPDDHCQYGH